VDEATPVTVMLPSLGAMREHKPMANRVNAPASVEQHFGIVFRSQQGGVSYHGARLIAAHQQHLICHSAYDVACLRWR
jgi:hypothetical protein